MSHFNLRKRKRISYYEPAEPNLDEYIFCSECKDFVFEYCAIHGPLLVIPDDKVPAQSPYPPCVPRSALSIPRAFLHLARSSIPGAGVGVFSSLTLPGGVRFGPYRGVDTTDPHPGYCWQIHDGNNKRSHYVDATDENNSNWMRFVNCSRHSSEQNLVAFQYRGMIYYRTIDIIPKFTELLVFYGGEFAHKLEINIRKYNSTIYYTPQLGLLNKEKPKEVVKAHKENTTKKPNFALEERPKESILNTSKLNKCNKDSNNFNKNIEKIKKYEPPKKIQKDTILTNLKNGLTEPIITKESKIDNQNEKLIINESKLSNNISLPKTTNIQIHVETGSNLLVPNSKYICDICNYEAVTKKYLIIHLSLHDSKEKIHFCTHCQYMTLTKLSLEMHLKKHTGEKPYQCNICQRKFSRLYSLKLHTKTHTGEKPYQCNICQRKFSQTITLKRHTRTHTGEKPYQCNICQKKFSQIPNLKSHIRTHTGEKTYQCNICQRKFSRLETLKSHTRTHTGEKPYQCNICQKKFSQTPYLKSHIRTHTGEKPYQCTLCTKKFTNKSNLNVHLKTHSTYKEN